MILKKYMVSNRHEYLRALWDLNLQNACFVRRAIYLHVQDADIAGNSHWKKEKKNRDESANHANSTVTWKISALYSSI